MRIPVFASVVLVLFTLGCRSEERKAATATPAAGRDAAAYGAWCAEHAVPEALCTKCNASLAPVFKAKGDWCAEHELPESVCPACGHGLTPPPATPVDLGPACAEHGVPEAFCTKCNPALIPVFKSKGDWCAEHEFPESVCPQCGGAAPAKGGAAGPDGQEIRLASGEVAGQAGLETTVTLAATTADEVQAPYRITFDATRVARVNARAAGVVTSLPVQVGDRVERGQVLALLRSAEVGAERAERDAARARVDAAEAEVVRSQELERSGLASTRDGQVARQELESARAQYDAAVAWLTQYGAETGAGTEYTLRSPLAGVVTSCPASVGEALADEAPLVEVVDPSRVWAELSIAEADLPRVRAGQLVRLRFANQTGEVVGTLASVAPSIDPLTRTATARVVVANPEGLLRANLYGTARIVTGDPAAAIVMPRAAIQEIDQAAYVFVKEADDLFVAREITLLRAEGAQAWAAAGVRAGEEIVTTGSFLLKTEVMKESIGAGCCDVD